EIVTLFLNSFPESMRSINVSSSPDQMRIAHGLKSSALHMGALALSERIGEVEDKLARPGAAAGHRGLKVCTNPAWTHHRTRLATSLTLFLSMLFARCFSTERALGSSRSAIFFD